MGIRRTRSLRIAATALAAIVLLPAAAQAVPPEEVGADRPNPFLAAFDVIVLRPMGLCAVVVGAAAFVPAVIVSAAGGRDNIDAAVEIFILEPTKNVFQRPLGDF